VFAGDLFEFSSAKTDDAGVMWDQLCSANAEVIAALQAHTATGGKVTLLAGNHDAPLTAVSEHVVERLGDSTTVEVAPWFVRRGGVHVEHGHLWDRDNAPLHPLADWAANTEPLGIALMRRFVVKRGALAFAHAHDTTPAAGITRAFRLFGVRAPIVIAQYFATAGALCFEAGRRRKVQALHAEAAGSGRLSQLAAVSGVETASLCAVLDGAPAPTHLRFSDTFMRLYFDRVLASVAAMASASSAVMVGVVPLTLGVFGLSSLYLASSVLRRGGRYQGPVQALREAASVIATALDARCVVFGHTHVPEASESYVNLGSFAYCPADGRPYAEIVDGSRVVPRRWAEA
jgi:hypothetical protein